MSPEVWDIIKAAGIPALLLTAIITSWCQVLAVKKGIQALLRDRLIQGYKFYRLQGWADEDDRSNLENVYVQYHRLGANGVMDNLRDKFLALPLGPTPPAPQVQGAVQPGRQQRAQGANPADTSIR